ncbi:MAG TPA: hypothetical protein VL335_02725 [Candidatus Paceibacterota bacterium]|jgi:hypothetical protein|nr:hypothetical protein [Candidatus Paceibacterota bacterium]
MEKKIVVGGFGACMIGGTPFGPESSFFNVAIKHLKDRHQTVESTSLSLGGFPITVARKHLRKIISQNPTHVVIQFSSVDITRSVGIKERVGLAKKASARTSAHGKGLRPSAPKTNPSVSNPLKPLRLKEQVRRWMKGGNRRNVVAATSNTSCALLLNHG